MANDSGQHDEATGPIENTNPESEPGNESTIGQDQANGGRRGRPSLTDEEREAKRQERNEAARLARRLLREQQAQSNPALTVEAGTATPLPEYRPKLGAGKPGPQPLPPTAVIDVQALSDLATSLFFNIGAIALGPEFAPDIPREQKHVDGVHAAFRKYFEVRGAALKATPELILAVALLGYSAMRVQEKPSLMARVSTWIGRFKGSLSLKR